MKTYWFLPCALIFLVTACSKNISLPLPPAEIKPVLNAIICEDSIIYARATLSDRLLRNFYPDTHAGFVAPEGAVLQLFRDGNYLEDLQPVSVFDKLFFTSKEKMQKGKQYSLRLNIPGYPEVQAGDVIPDGQSFDLSDMHVFMTNTAYGYQETNFSFTLHNKADTGSCYYLFRLYSLFNYTSMENTGKQWTWVDYKHNTPQIIGSGGSYQYMGLLSDRPIAAGAASVFTLTAGPQQYDTMMLEVSVLTDPCYRYLSTFEKALRTLDDPTAEKISVYNNVTGGFGIVGAMATRAYLVTK